MSGAYDIGAAALIVGLILAPAVFWDYLRPLVVWSICLAIGAGSWTSHRLRRR